MKKTELQGRSRTELQQLIERQRNSLAEVRLKLHTGNSKQTREARAIKKDIARSLTKLKAANGEEPT